MLGFSNGVPFLVRNSKSGYIEITLEIPKGRGIIHAACLLASCLLVFSAQTGTCYWLCFCEVSALLSCMGLILNYLWCWVLVESGIRT